MKPADIALLRQAGEVRLSPDGATAAFTVVSVDMEANDYHSRIWLTPVDGSSAPYPFSSGSGKDVLPRWSPDGRRLAFVSQRDDGRGSAARTSRESASWVVLVLPVSVGGEPILVCRMGDDVSELEWSPDGTRLVLVARDRDPDRYGTAERPLTERDMPPRRIDRFYSRLDTAGWTFDRPRRVFVAPADGSGPARSVTPGPYEASHVSWSPDGRLLAFASARHDSWDLDLASDLWTVPADGGAEPARLTDTTAEARYPSWSADGTRIAFLTTPTPLEQPRNTQVAVIDVSTGAQVDLSTALDRNCAPFGSTRPPVWCGDQVLFAVEDSGNVSVYKAPADGGGKPSVVVGGDQMVTAWDLVGETLAWVASTPLRMSELFIGVHSERVTRFTEALTATVELSEPERFIATSPDGTEVECWAMRPVGAEAGRRYPTLLNIHGGPFTQYGNRFFDEFQIQAGAGYGVVYCNPRGSSGYSEASARAIRWPEADADPGTGWGTVDYDDVMACIAEAARRFDWVDPSRLGVLGGSYGGYMTSWIIGHSDKFRAACSERACNDLLTLDLTSDIASSFRTYVGKSHLDAPDAYVRRSPITYVREMTTPVLILHSEQDLRCPVGQAEELFVALRLLGRDPEMVRFPGESHELSRSGSPKHRVMRAELILDWFGRHLG